MGVVSERVGSAPRGARDEAMPSRRRRRRPVRAALLAVTVLAVVAVAAGLLARTFGLLPAGNSASRVPVHGVAAPLEPFPSELRRSSCVVGPQQPRMLTPAELADPSLQGTWIDQDGNPQPCAKPGLYIPPAPGGTPDVGGQVILISLGQQWLWAYQDRTLAFANPVTTGKEWLWTPQGTYHIQYKVQDTWFYSPWGPDSPFYYAPEHVNYALYFRDKGYYIHDAPWRHAFGPGTNVPHTSPDGTEEDGSHGCVNVATAAGKWLFDWTQVGATVIIVD